MLKEKVIFLGWKKSSFWDGEFFTSAKTKRFQKERKNTILWVNKKPRAFIHRAFRKIKWYKKRKAHLFGMVSFLLQPKPKGFKKEKKNTILGYK